MRLRPARVRSVASAAADAVVTWLRPDLSSPAATLATVAWLDAFTPSLMPRTSAMQGVVAGASVLTSRAVAGRVERTLAPALGHPDATARRLAVRAAVAVAGAGLSGLPDARGEPAWHAALRGGGTVLRSIAAGGAIHDVGRALWVRKPTTGALPAAVAATSVVTGVAIWADRRRRQHTAAVAPWPLEQRNTLPQGAAISAVVVLLGRGVGEAVEVTGDGLRRWLGRGRAKGAFAAVINAGLWTGAASLAYRWAVAWVGRTNDVVEPSYDRAPRSGLVSGGPGSGSAFALLGRQGRRFVTDVLDAATISGVMGEPAADPIRVYVGFAAQPLHPTWRAEQALEELERTGAYRRRFLLLVSPTGTGWVDESTVESAELFARGDIATCAIQYGMFPSFLAVQKVALGRSQFRILLLGVRERLRGMPPGERPTVLVAGESLGAWTASDVIMHTGIGGFDHYGIDRALWIGLPHLAKWSSSGMSRRTSALVPEGTVVAVDRAAELEALDPAARERLRAVVLSHDNDPIALLSPRLLVQPAEWLRRTDRGRGVPADMRWTPFVTFLQVAVDALNSFVQVPGAFTSFGHDYRGDMARAVHAAFDMPAVTPMQMAAVESALVERDLARARRLGKIPG